MQGTSCLSLLMVGAGIVWGKLLRLKISQTVFVSSCLSLSSTPLVSKFLSGASRAEKEGKWSHFVVISSVINSRKQESLYFIIANLVNGVSECLFCYFVCVCVCVFL